MPRPPPAPLTDDQRDRCAAYWPLAVAIARRALDVDGEWVDGDELRSLAGWIAVCASARWRPGGRSYPGYLRGRLANLRADARRRVRSRRRGWLDAEEGPEPADPGPARAVEIADAGDELDAALDRLDPRHAIIARAVWLDGLTDRAAARLARVRPELVGPILSAALMEMRREQCQAPSASGRGQSR